MSDRGSKTIADFAVPLLTRWTPTSSPSWTDKRKKRLDQVARALSLRLQASKLNSRNICIMTAPLGSMFQMKTSVSSSSESS